MATTRTHEDAPIVAEVVRSGFVEARHRGHVIALESDGSVAWSIGEVTRPIHPRSANKPLQALAMVRAGLGLEGELLALVCASHAGEDFHAQSVTRILADVGLDATALRCPPARPEDEDALASLLRSGRDANPIRNNCSGKHSGMLATCVRNGWPTRTYVDPDHLLQKGIRATIEELTGETVAHTAVDGCGAPAFAFSLAGLARAYRALALGASGTPERRIADAVAAHPTWVSGTRRDEAKLIGGVPGLLAKGGAEACYAAALPDGRTVALKIDDGANRARPVVMAAALRRLGVDAPVLDELASSPLLGGGARIGEIRPVFS